MKKKVFTAKMIFMALILSLCFGISCPVPAAAAAAPKKVTVQSIRVTGAGKVKISWKKVSKVTKYQVQTAADKKFTKEKQTKKVSAKKNTVSVSKLDQDKTYYVRVRAYRTRRGRNYYGKWSAVKKINLEKDTGADGTKWDENSGPDRDAELSEDDFEIVLKSTFYYTGEEIRPAVISLSLTEGVDYEVTYSNNVDVGRASITITGIGDYYGKIVKYFNISKARQNIKVLMADSTMQVGESQKVSVSGAYGELKYEASPEGIVSVSKDGTITALKAGSASVYLSAGGDAVWQAYNRYLVIKITVTEKEKAGQKIKVSLEGSQMTVGSTQKVSVSEAYGELKWQFSTEGIVSISEDGVVTALKTGSTSIYLSAAGDDEHKAVERHYAGRISVIVPSKEKQYITAELEKTSMYIGKTQKINVSGASGELSFEVADEGIVSISPDGTVTGQKAGWTDIYLNASGDETHRPVSKLKVGRVIVGHEEATACGFSGGLVGPYKKESYYDARKADGTASFTIRFYCNSDEAWMDQHVVFEALDVTAAAYTKMFADMGIAPSAPKMVLESCSDNLYAISMNNPYKVELPFSETGAVASNEIAISGKKITVNIDPGTRVVKLVAKKGEEILDYIYLGTSNRKTSSDSAAFDRDLYKRVRERIEARLWTDGMSNGDKIGALAGYINATAHYPDSPTTNPYENPTYWEDWAVDGKILEYWMFEDVTLSEIMALRGGIADCYAAQILNRAAKEDLGLTYLFDGKTVADGEGVWIGTGSQSSNPSNPGHMSLWYKDAEGKKGYFDASGLDGGYNKGVTCEEHDCRSKIIPLG